MEFVRATSPAQLSAVVEMINSGHSASRAITVETVKWAPHFVAVQDGEMIGRVGVRKPNFIMSEIFHTYVRFDSRGNGVAGFLIEQAIRFQNKGLVIATIRESNKPSQRLFEKHGFKSIARKVHKKIKVILYLKDIRSR